LVAKIRDALYPGIVPNVKEDQDLVIRWNTAKNQFGSPDFPDFEYDFEIFRQKMLEHYSFRPAVGVKLVPAARITTLMAGATDVTKNRRYRNGQQISSNQVDLSLFARWLSHCQRVHSDCGDGHRWDRTAGELKKNGQFRLIDVNSMCVVSATPGCSYVALSYVWGASQTLRAKKADFIKSKNGGMHLNLSSVKLPRTIDHAIQVTKLLKEKYLWVDAICIMQDDPEELANNISAMDLIYKASKITIVAAAGDNSEVGLPGLLPGSRAVEQIRENVNGITLMVPQPELESLLSKSTWSTRAWTFQEERLSKRKLVFIDGLVYYKCAEDTWCEDIFEGDDNHAKRWQHIVC
jgi:hypothetical protein